LFFSFRFLLRYGWKQQAERRKDRAPRKELAPEPKGDFSQFKDSVQLQPPRPGVQRKFRLVYVDTSERFRDEERPILVEEVDMSVRTTDWTERRTLMTLYRARRRKLRKNLRGMLSMEVLLDVDRFYMDDTPIGMPDYWPNNQRPAPTTFERLVDRLHRLPHWVDLKNKKAPSPVVVAVGSGDAASAAPPGGEAAPVVEAASESAPSEASNVVENKT
jgi:hypothetical protein